MTQPQPPQGENPNPYTGEEVGDSPVVGQEESTGQGDVPTEFTPPTVEQEEELTGAPVSPPEPCDEEPEESAPAESPTPKEDSDEFGWPGLSVSNRCDINGNPAGGWADSVGLRIDWQDGPLGQGAGRHAPNGAFVEVAIQAVLARLNFFQEAAKGKFACQENTYAIECLEASLEYLRKRSRGRIKRGVEGINEP